uniref:Uncharacterized protein n=1 Tax=Romanomermis culicivorax TaxID=13658 RepID=A0A915IW59_ROMCU
MQHTQKVQKRSSAGYNLALKGLKAQPMLQKIDVWRESTIATIGYILKHADHIPNPFCVTGKLCDLEFDEKSNENRKFLMSGI